MNYISADGRDLTRLRRRLGDGTCAAFVFVWRTKRHHFKVEVGEVCDISKTALSVPFARILPLIVSDRTSSA